MAVQLFNLRNVPEDEADEIRALLEAHEIDFYETPGGNWGISLPALWLRDEARLEEAKALIERYQRERAVQAREVYDREAPKSLFQAVIERPLHFIAVLALIALVLYISLAPFLKL